AKERRRGGLMMSGVEVEASYQGESDHDGAHRFHKMPLFLDESDSKRESSTSLILISLCKYGELRRRVPPAHGNYRSRDRRGAPFPRTEAAPWSGAPPRYELPLRSNFYDAGESAPVPVQTCRSPRSSCRSVSRIRSRTVAGSRSSRCVPAGARVGLVLSNQSRLG